MDLPAALKGQYRAGLAMLRECVLMCPDDLWSATCGQPPRTLWRIAYHAVFYTHLYLMVRYEDFAPWDRHIAHGSVLWDDDEEGMPPDVTPLTQSDLAEYIDWVDAHVEHWIDAIDFSSKESGFDWYPIPKLDHQILNIRHLGIHLGQLQEHLYARGLEPHWVARR
ncbi:MAG: hypothetical protein ACK4XJ_08635 [Fimbriimonadaceae bacterium]